MIVREPMIAEALVLVGDRHFERRSIPIPDIGEFDGLLKVEACGLCGTDHEQYTGHLRAPFSFIPGHEVVGTIERLGDAAAQRWGVRQGQRVAVEVFHSCRECQQCRSGTYRRCERNGFARMVGFIDVERPPGLWGGYSTHLYLPPDSMLLPVPDDLNPVLAVLFNPLGAGVRWASTLPDTSPGDVVAVLGPGIRGLSATVAAREAGAGFVMLTGVGPRDRPRLEQASAFGADLAIDITEQDPVAALRTATGGLADIVIDVTAKAPAAFAQAIALTRPGGTVVVAGTRGTLDTPGFSPDQIVYKEIRILGALGVDVTAYSTALQILSSRKYPFETIPRRVAGLDDLESLIMTMAGEGDPKIPVHGVLVP